MCTSGVRYDNPDNDDWFQWLRDADRPPVVGDSVALGQAELSVRAMEGGQIRRVGIRLG